MLPNSSLVDYYQVIYAKNCPTWREPEAIYEEYSQRTFFTTSNEVIWPKVNKFHADCHTSLSEKLPKWHFLTHE